MNSAKEKCAAHKPDANLEIGKFEKDRRGRVLERKRHAAAEAALILREHQHRAVIQQVRAITLRQQVSHIHHGVNTHSIMMQPNRLPDVHIQIRFD